MSPPIYTPDGTEVSEVVLPDGSTASEVVVDGQTVFSAIPDSGLLRYNFNNDNNDTSIAADAWGSLDGDVIGATHVTSGGYDDSGAYDFDGTDDKVQTPTDTALTFSDTPSLSVAAWVNPDNLNNRQFVWTARYSSGSAKGEFAPGIQTDGTVRYYTSGGEFYSTETVSTSSLTLIVQTMADDGTMTGYIGSSSVGSTSASIDQVDYWEVSSDRFDPVDGLVDEYRMYDKELSASEVSNLDSTGSIS